MSNFDNFVSDMKVVAGEVGKKAEEYVEMSKLRLERVTIKGDIQKNFSKIGELAYAAKKTGEPGDEVIRIYIEEIDEQYKRLSEIAGRISELNNKARCPVCGAQNQVGADYCSKCGARLGMKTQANPEPEKSAQLADKGVQPEQEKAVSETKDAEGETIKAAKEVMDAIDDATAEL